MIVREMQINETYLDNAKNHTIHNIKVMFLRKISTFRLWVEDIGANALVSLKNGEVIIEFPESEFSEEQADDFVSSCKKFNPMFWEDK
jgi:hypothetical protein